MASQEDFPVQEAVKSQWSGAVISWMIRLTASVRNLVTGSGFTFPNGGRAVVTDATGGLTESVVTSTEIEKLDGVTANVQTQLNAKVPYSGATGAVDLNDKNLTNVNALDADTAAFGGATDYSSFEADGTLVFNGAATVTKDLIGAITQVQVLGTGVSLNATESTMDFTTGANLSDYGWINFQVQHDWKLGTSIYPHIHWEQTSNATPNWLLRYRWQRNGQAKTTAWTDYACTTNAFTYVSGTLNQISYGAAVAPPAGYSLSDIVEVRIFRDNANTSTVFAGADTYSGTVGITSMDIHYEADTVGSRTEYTK